MRDFETGLTAEEARRLFRYVKSTGLLIRRVAAEGRSNSVLYPAGSVAGTMRKDGYCYTAIRGRQYLVHRLIWLIVTGDWPTEEIDHKNGIGSDNRWKNLRDASVHQNRRNTLGQTTRKGPFPGVYKPANRKGFIAQIKRHGEVIYLGKFQWVEAAWFARLWAEAELFGAFAGHRREV